MSAATVRRVGVMWRKAPLSLPYWRLRWRHGDRPREVYLSTPRYRFWLANHKGGQIELQVCRFPKRRKGESGIQTGRPCWLTESFHEFSYDGATPGDGEWFEDDVAAPEGRNL